jgi:hypothetical protein
MSVPITSAPTWKWTPLSAEADAALDGVMAALPIYKGGVIWRLVEGDPNERGGNGGPEASASESDWKLVNLLIEGGCRDDALIREIVEHSGCLVPGREGKLLRRRDYLPRLITNALKSAKPEKLERPAVDGQRLDVTAADLAKNPDLLKLPTALTSWLVWRGDLVMVVGREKDGKSTLAGADAAAALRAGLTVLWVTAEESLNRVVKRFVDLGAPLDKLILLRRWPQTWEEVEAAIETRKPDAIYVDTVSSFLMAVDGGVPQTSEGEAWQAKMLRFKAWATIGRVATSTDAAAGVAVLKHGTKADGGYAGSVGIGAGPDTIITLRAVAEYPTYRRLETIGRWGFPSKIVRYVSPTAGYEDVANFDAAPATTALRISAERQRVLRALPGTAKAPTGTTWGDWLAEYATARKVDVTPGLRSTFNGAVTWLRDNGLIALDDETGRYTRNEMAVNDTVVEGK